MVLRFDHVMPLSRAASLLKLSESFLKSLVESGKLSAVKQDGDFLVDADMVFEMVEDSKVRDSIWSKVKRFDGEAIGVEDARELVSGRTLSRCVRLGYVRVLGGDSAGGRGHKKLLNKADVLYVYELAKHVGAGRGRRIFSEVTVPPHILG